MISVQMSLNVCSEPYPYLCMLMFCVVLVCVHLYAQAFVAACVYARACACNAQHVALGKSSKFLLMLGKSDEAGRSGIGVKRGSQCFPHGSRRSQKEREAWK